MEDEPKICYFCNNEEKYCDWEVHHINGDESDNRRENLAWSHLNCHRGYHSSEREWTDESRAKMRKLRKQGVIGAQPGHIRSEETKRKIGEANRKINLKKLKELSDGYTTISKIVAEMGFHRSTIRRWQKRLGVYKTPEEIRSNLDNQES